MPAPRYCSLSRVRPSWLLALSLALMLLAPLSRSVPARQDFGQGQELEESEKLESLAGPQNYYDEKSIENGRAWFSREWQENDRHSPRGDGIGPRFNARSCAACHNQGGTGGGGGNQHNVFVLSVQIPQKTSPGRRQQFADKVVRLHPGFEVDGVVQESLILHHQSTDPEYENFRSNILGFVPPANWPEPQQKAFRHAAQRRFASVDGLIRLPRQNGVPFIVTQRNTPPLFGAGLLDSITLQDLETLVAEQAERGTGISGRIAVIGKQPGRFGWRGQIATTREFVIAACSNELGLEVESIPDSVSTRTRASKGFHSGNQQPLRDNEFDLSFRQGDELIAFVRALPRPQQILPDHPGSRKAILEGEHIFNRIDCGICHQKKVGNLDGLYSDLLLHDMGRKLEDPVAAADPRTANQTSPSYYGSARRLVASLDPQLERDLRREWKTPPLWGVADSAPYLHDGRAPTLTAAILAHGGESENSVNRFRTLPTRDKKKLIAFLKSLKAPQTATPPEASEAEIQTMIQAIKRGRTQDDDDDLSLIVNQK